MVLTAGEGLCLCSLKIAYLNRGVAVVAIGQRDPVAQLAEEVVAPGGKRAEGFGSDGGGGVGSVLLICGASSWVVVASSVIAGSSLWHATIARLLTVKTASMSVSATTVIICFFTIFIFLLGRVPL
jgi:hypothetical protein